jgi:hypothetical protein
MDIIWTVEMDTLETTNTLSFKDGPIPDSDMLRKLLETATESVESGGRSLAAV